MTPRLSLVGPLAAALFSLASPLRADTEVCGTLALAAEWTASGSPYLVTGDIFIPATSRLRIGPGVVVRFARPSAKRCPTDTARLPQADWSDSAYTGIKAEGTFYCLGSEDKPVVFEPAPPGAPEAGRPPAARSPVGWDGVRLSGQNASAAEIAFAVFRGANQALTAEKTACYVHHCLFEGNNTGIYLGMRGDLSVINCVFQENLSAGVVIRKGGPRIANSIFVGNHSYGIWGDGRNLARITYNDFWRSGEEHCYHCPFPVLAAEGKRSKDTTKAAGDPLGNLMVDPVFTESQSEGTARAADLKTPTPAHLVKDPALAKLEADSRAKTEKASPGFRPLGKGPCLLSEYSKLRDAGHPGRDFRDRDGTRNDIGLHGGPMTRITSDPF